MTPGLSLWIAAAIAALLSIGFAVTARLPLPVPYFSAVAAGVLAFLGTLSLVAWMPRRWLWTEAELLRVAFQARHGLSADAAQMSLEAITTAHRRAARLRDAAAVMRDDMADHVTGLADRLDAAAREIFYVPERRRSLATVLGRSELIEEAALAHASLRRRNHRETEDASRDRLRAAVDALEAALDQTDLLAARGLLHQVEVASDVAETLLKPRRNLTTSQTHPS